MCRLPTDREVLKCIYEMYETDYPGETNAGRGINDPYVPVDLKAVAANLKMKPELLFGRLYYHLDAKHRYKQDDGTLVSLFHLNISNRGHSVHFPYMAAILADHDQEYRKHFWSMAFSVLALVLSLVSLVTNLLTKYLL